MKIRKFEKNDIVAFHFNEPSSIGWNGVVAIVLMYRYDEKTNRWMYGCESKYGSGFAWAYEDEMIKQNQRVNSYETKFCLRSRN